MTSPPERPFSHYIHSHHLAAEMWTKMKNNLLGKKFLSCSFYFYRFRRYVSYGFPIIIFCNPGVHYETPCIIFLPATYDFNATLLYGVKLPSRRMISHHIHLTAFTKDFYDNILLWYWWILNVRILWPQSWLTIKWPGWYCNFSTWFMRNVGILWT
jgi:hypothetical protein